MAKDVRCEVNSCRYWADENRCRAETIFIQKHVKEASKPAETDCGTFETK